MEDFSPSKWGKYGRYNYCKSCHREYAKERNPKRQEIDEKVTRRLGLKRQGLKTCSNCKEILSLEEEFYDDPRHADGKQSICKTCWNLKINQAYLKKEYDLTIADYTSLLEAQSGLCAICGRAPKRNKFNIDHSHATHKIRALLCVNCNTNLLPIVERYPDWVKRAFEYLENPPAFAVIGERFVPETNQARKRIKPRIAEYQEPPVRAVLKARKK